MDYTKTLKTGDYVDTFFGMGLSGIFDNPMAAIGDLYADDNEDQKLMENPQVIVPDQDIPVTNMERNMPVEELSNSEEIATGNAGLDLKRYGIMAAIGLVGIVLLTKVIK